MLRLGVACPCTTGFQTLSRGSSTTWHLKIGALVRPEAGVWMQQHEDSIKLRHLPRQFMLISLASGFGCERHSRSFSCQSHRTTSLVPTVSVLSQHQSLYTKLAEPNQMESCMNVVPKTIGPSPAKPPAQWQPRIAQIYLLCTPSHASCKRVGQHCCHMYVATCDCKPHCPPPTNLPISFKPQIARCTTITTHSRHVAGSRHQRSRSGCEVDEA